MIKVLTKVSTWIEYILPNSIEEEVINIVKNNDLEELDRISVRENGDIVYLADTSYFIPIEEEKHEEHTIKVMKDSELLFINSK